MHMLYYSRRPEAMKGTLKKGSKLCIFASVGSKSVRSPVLEDELELKVRKVQTSGFR